MVLIKITSSHCYVSFEQLAGWLEITRSLLNNHLLCAPYGLMNKFAFNIIYPITLCYVCWSIVTQCFSWGYYHIQYSSNKTQGRHSSYQQPHHRNALSRHCDNLGPFCWGSRIDPQLHGLGCGSNSVCIALQQLYSNCLFGALVSRLLPTPGSRHLNHARKLLRHRQMQRTPRRGRGLQWTSWLFFVLEFCVAFRLYRVWNCETWNLTPISKNGVCFLTIVVLDAPNRISLS